MYTYIYIIYIAILRKNSPVFPTQVSNLVHLIDPKTLRVAELLPLTFWKKQFIPALVRSNLIEYVFL